MFRRVTNGIKTISHQQCIAPVEISMISSRPLVGWFNYLAGDRRRLNLISSAFQEQEGDAGQQGWPLLIHHHQLADQDDVEGIQERTHPGRFL